MRKLAIWMVSAPLLSIFLGCSHSERNRSPVVPTSTPELYFYTNPTKQLFWMGEPVVIGLELYSRLEQPVLVGGLQGNEFVKFKVVGPDGKEVLWQGAVSDRASTYSPTDFTVLGQYTTAKADRTISLKNGEGFSFIKSGQYTLTAVFAMGAPENFAAFTNQAKPAVGSFRSSKLMFCIEVCTFKPLPVSNNVPPSALEAVRRFYTYITKYQQLGIPYGRAKKALWPLMTERLAQEIDGLDACDKDYYRRYGKILRAHTYKPTTPWLETGLFTGPNDAATPPSFRILGSRSAGENRVDVLLAFKEDWGESQGDVTAVFENGRWVIDDYMPMYENDDLSRLSAGYSACKDGRWVGEPAY